jgi:ABC-type nitrate/sulfonate/bicarbonate transport system permease component
MEHSIVYTIGYLMGVGFGLAIVLGIPAAFIFGLHRLIRGSKKEGA